jgi:hypothetical protein
MATPMRKSYRSDYRIFVQNIEQPLASADADRLQEKG